MKKKNPRRARIIWLFAIIALCVLAYGVRKPVLTSFGAYLAPAEKARADVVIVEGETTVQTRAVNEAVALMRAGDVKKVIVVIHELAGGKDIFSLPQKYPELVRQGMLKKGLKKNEFEIIAVPIGEPVTISEAKHVLAHLAKQDCKSAIIKAKGFHSRRSLLAYRYVGNSMNIYVFPSTFYVGYQLESWWRYPDGFRDFFSESFKLFYYSLRGYIPLISLFTLRI